MPDDYGTRGLGDLPGGVRGSVVDDDYPIRLRQANGSAHRFGDAIRLVVRRDNDRHHAPILAAHGDGLVVS
jgi:hypothetical protein